MQRANTANTPSLVKTVLLLSVMMLAVMAACGNNEDDFNSEGTSSSPKSFSYSGSGLSESGSVGSTISYYRVTGLSDDTEYTVSISGLTEDADLFVYESDFSSDSIECVSVSGTNSESCSHTTGSGITELYIQVKPIAYSNGSRFTLSVSP